MKHVTKLTAFCTLSLLSCSNEGSKRADRDYQITVLHADIGRYQACKVSALAAVKGFSSNDCKADYEKMKYSLRTLIGDEGEADRAARSIAYKTNQSVFAASILYAAKLQKNL